MCFISLISCSNKAEMQSKNNKDIDPLPSPPTNKVEKQLTDNANQIHPLPPPGNLFELQKGRSNKESNQLDREIYSEINNFSKTAGLVSLKQEKFLSGDKEVRVWIHDGDLFEMDRPIKGFVSSYKQGKQSAFAIYTKASKNNPAKKYLDMPKSGWINWWSYLENQKFVFNETDKKPSFNPDAGFLIVEAKTSQAYVYSIFSQPETNNNTISSSSLCKKISEEFDIIFNC